MISFKLECMITHLNEYTLFKKCFIIFFKRKIVYTDDINPKTILDIV